MPTRKKLTGNVGSFPTRRDERYKPVFYAYAFTDDDKSYCVENGSDQFWRSEAAAMRALANFMDENEEYVRGSLVERKNIRVYHRHKRSTVDASLCSVCWGVMPK